MAVNIFGTFCHFNCTISQSITFHYYESTLQTGRTTLKDCVAMSFYFHHPNIIYQLVEPQSILLQKSSQSSVPSSNACYAWFVGCTTKSRARDRRTRWCLEHGCGVQTFFTSDSTLQHRGLWRRTTFNCTDFEPLDVTCSIRHKCSRFLHSSSLLFIDSVDRLPRSCLISVLVFCSR